MDKKSLIPIWEKAMLSVKEAAEYSGIGEKSLRNVLRQPGCPFVFYVGRKTLVKRKELEAYISKRGNL